MVFFKLIHMQLERYESPKGLVHILNLRLVIRLTLLPTKRARLYFVPQTVLEGNEFVPTSYKLQCMTTKFLVQVNQRVI